MDKIDILKSLKPLTFKGKDVNKFTNEEIEMMFQKRREGVGIKQIADVFNISKGQLMITMYRYAYKQKLNS